MPATSPGAESAALKILSRVFTSEDLEEGSLRLLDGLQGRYGVSGGLVVLRRGGSGRILASRGLPAGWISSWEAESAHEIEARLAPSLVHEPLEAPPGLIDSVLKRSGVRGMLTLPLGSPAQPEGAVVLSSTRENPFPEEDRTALETVVAALAYWLQVRLFRGQGPSVPSPEAGPVAARPRRAGEGGMVGEPAGEEGGPEEHERGEEMAEAWGSVAAASLDGEGRIRKVSPSLGRLLRARRRELSGRGFAELLSAADVPRFREAVDRVCVEGASGLPGVHPAGVPDALGRKHTVDLILAARDEELLVFAVPSTVGMFVGQDSDVGDALAQQPDLGIIRLDREGRVLTWPGRATRLLGWREQEIRGRSVRTIFAREDRTAWNRRLLERTGGAGGEWAVALRASDGESVPCGVRLLFLEDAEDVLFILRDRRGEEAAEKWLRWSRALLSVLGVSTLVLDAGGRIRELGSGWVTGGKRRLSEWLGRHVAELFETDRREIVSALRQAARQGEWTGSLVANGLPVPVRLKSVRDGDGVLEALVGARLPECSNEVRDLFRKIPVGMILVDTDFCILETNPELAAICGDEALPGNPVGLDVRSLAIFQTREAQAALDGLKDHHGFDLPEVHLKGTAEESLLVQFRGKELTDEAGDVTGYLLMLLSRTGKTQVEKQILRAQKMESIGNFASGLAHDFGNFVSVILGKAGVLRVKLPDDPHITRDLDDIESAAKRAQHLAQELMKFARGGRNRIASLHLNRLIEEVGSLIQTSVGKKIEVTLRLDEAASPVEGDEVELQQMVLNLCLNARDAMPDGGCLVLETRPLTLEQLARLATGQEVEAGVCLVVKDTGMGMPPEVVERVFEPFFSTKDDTKGTGLGLAMVYGIVRRHGGTIDVHSAPGLGTTFEIALPAATQDGEGGVAGHEILVVDDEPAFREMIRLILEEDGHRVHLAANGVEALKTLREDYERLGLVILDLRMPGIDGLGVLAELREMAPDLPVLVTTGYASPEEKEQAIRGGAQQVLEKPYRVSDLRGALAVLLGEDEGGPGAAAGSGSTGRGAA